MKPAKILLSALILTCATALGVAGFSLAWLSGAKTEVDMNSAHGGVVSQYFHCGSGTEQDPYVITRPVHLYNLTQLYKLKPEEFATNNIHYQVGYDLDGNSNTLEVYEYENGVFQEDICTTLDMTDQPIIPIGNATNPFVGKFDGSGIIIDNLTVADSGASDLGFFGYVDEGAEIHDIYLDNLTIDTNGAVAGHSHEHANTGYIAGHIEDALCFTNVYVNHASLTGTGNVNNDWGYFGYCKNAASLEAFIDKAEQGEEEAWGGSFHSQFYTNLLYETNHSTTSETTNSITGQGGYTIKKTASATSNPASNQVVYRLRDGSFIPLKFTDNRAALTNTGYLVGSNIGTGANASPKISSYKMINLQNALSNTRSTNMADTYKASGNITYDDSKLEVLTYQNGWKRIKDDHNAQNNSTNAAITSYTRTDVADLGFVKYTASRAALQETLTGTNFIHGIHFDNNAISTSNLLTVSANTARVQGSNITTTYQLPKGSIDFNLKEEGFINFFAGTYNSSQVNLNFFSLYQVTRNANGNITALTQIKKIYKASSGAGYIYQTGNSKPSGAGDLAFDVETILHGNAPVINMMYYFEIPVNAGEYAMGVAGSTQGAYMIYLDLGANGGTESELVDDFTTVEYRDRPETTEHSIVLVRYQRNADTTVTVYYKQEKYYIITNCSITAVLLNNNYEVWVNGTRRLTQIGQYNGA